MRALLADSWVDLKPVSGKAREMERQNVPGATVTTAGRLTASCKGRGICEEEQRYRRAVRPRLPAPDAGGRSCTCRRAEVVA